MRYIITKLLTLCLNYLGKGSSKADEVWRVVERESVDEDFDIPEGFEFVDINEQNFRNYVSKIKDLLTEEIGGKDEYGVCSRIFDRSCYLSSALIGLNSMSISIFRKTSAWFSWIC